MSDISTVWMQQKIYGDYVLAGAQLMSDTDLQTAILISFFTDRIAHPDDVILDGSGDPRGWIGDVPGDPPIGSRFWLIDRSKQTNQVLNEANQYAVECVQWLIDDGVVQKFDITVEFTRPGMLGIEVIAYRVNGQQLPALKFSYVWGNV